MLLKRLVPCLLLLAVMAVPVLITGCNVVTGSGKTVTWEMDFSDFNAIDAGYSFRIQVTRSDEFLVRITIDENLNEYLSVDQRGDTLRIGLEPGTVYTNTRQEAVITLPDLRRLELSGASKAAVSGFTTDHAVDYELSGAGRLELDDMSSGDTSLDLSGASEARGNITMDNGEFDLSGASTLELEGSAGDINIDGSGASEILLEDFPVTNAKISLSGASNAVVKLDGRMDLDLSGASEVEYIGNPRLGSIEMSGGSSVNQR
jgi:predicted small secreted protein